MKRKPQPFFADSAIVKSGASTDVYFERTKAVLEKAGMADVGVAAEIHAYSLPHGFGWAVFTGLEEAAWLLEGLPINLYAVEEGTVFRAMEPVARVEGRYVDFATYEPSLLGILRHSTSVSTKAARIKVAAGDKPVLFFGIRSVHPVIAPMVDRAAYLGGCDAVSGVVGASAMGLEPLGTMPHALILVVGDEAKAWKLFHETMPEKVPRIALVDTFHDERFESLKAAETLGEKLYGVRLDTPASRRGNMRKIVAETKWTLSIQGFGHVKIFVSGGLDEESIKELVDVVDGFGVGTSIAFPESVDLALDIVERMNTPVSKRGKLPGRKQVFRCVNMHDIVTVWGKSFDSCPECDASVTPLLKPIILEGKVVADFPSPQEIRERVLSQLKKIREAGAEFAEPIFAP